MKTKPLNVPTAITLLLGILPFIPYGWARVFGTLPSEADWDKRGGNHGPWWGHDPHEALIGGPMFLLAILPFLTIIAALIISPSHPRGTVIPKAIGLCLLQWGLAFLQVSTLVWLID